MKNKNQKEKINKEMTEIWIAIELLYVQQAIERIKDVFKEYIKLCQKKNQKIKEQKNL